ncbi:MAG: alkaline phosphatase family protein [Planctomycetes bacterium]|nr:alkaline phosphatase family protein [Planctomycetota bacterium]
MNRRSKSFALVAALVLAFPGFAAAQTAGSVIDHVILISVDGLRPDAVINLGASALPNFFRFRQEGAGTDNARADADQTITMPNHISMVTGHPVQGSLGHNWLVNSDPLPGDSIHLNAGAYVASAFDVAHDHGLSTALYASKSKFVLFDQSYDALNGASDSVGVDNGNDKIDLFVFNADIQGLVSQYTADLSAFAFGLSMLHIADTDLYGHGFFFDATPGSLYSNQLQVIDLLLGQVFAVVENDPNLMGSTAIVLTSDHGGVGNNHVTSYLRENYTVPFHVWGPGVAANTDPYFTNSAVRAEPGGTRPDYTGPQPIRSGDAANLLLDLLGLPSIPGSSINGSAVALDVMGPPNISPVANAMVTPGATGNPMEVELEGGGSTDADGTVGDWIWWISDGTLLFGPSHTHVFAGPGSFTATLWIRDDRGGSAFDVASIQIAPPANMPPTVMVQPASGPIDAAQSLVVILDEPDGLGDLTGLQINVQPHGVGPWYQMFIPSLLSNFTAYIDAQGRGVISWADLGFWTNLGVVNTWNFQVNVSDSAGHMVTVTRTYTPMP